MKSHIVMTQCPVCHRTTPVEVDLKGYENWRRGELIQCALPTLSVRDRELLMTGICAACWEATFGPDSDDTDDEEEEAAEDPAPVLEVCRMCSGVGALKDHSPISVDDHVTCPHCDGHGETEIVTVPCMECWSTGRIGDTVCRMCNGAGWLT